MTSQQQEQNAPALRFPEFKGGWEFSRLSKRVTKVGSGVTPKGGSNVYQSNGIPLLRSQNVRDSVLDLTDVAFISEEINSGMGGSAVQPQDVLLNITGASIGRSCVVPSELDVANVNQHVCIIRLNGENSPNFLQSFLASHKGKKLIFQSQAGGGREGLNFENIRTFKTTFPTLPEQQKIATFLSAVDRKIEQLTQKKELLEQYKKGLMQKLFSQDLRFKDDHGNDFPDWEEKRLGNLVQVINGLTYSPSDIGKDGLLVLRSSNVQQGHIQLSDNVFVGLEVDTDKLTQEGDILLCVRNGSQRLIGKSAQIPAGIPKATHGAFMSLLRGEKNNFIFQLLQTPLFFKEVHKNLGATINSINGSDLKKFKFWFPTHPDEQQKIVDFLSAIDKKIDLIAAELTYAQAFKKGLLQQMFV